MPAQEALLGPRPLATPRRKSQARGLLPLLRPWKPVQRRNLFFL
uniref:Uncharacterized protein n=1 Tax=Arundo donax TaxID=35708 RepID=A0A0A9C4M9_ARUDO